MYSIIINILFQIFCFIAFVYLAGFVIGLINRTFYGLFESSRTVIYATGLIGTPIHESAHAIMCLLFGHKIEKIKFFQIDDESGVLGYVNHSYNPKNYYAVVGNYFIGVAPILAGCLILSLSFYFLLPETYRAIHLVAETNGKVALANLGKAISSFFSEIGNWKFWVLILINICIALHMTLSDADIKGTLKALPILIGLLVLVNVILGNAWPKGYATFSQAVNGAGVSLFMFLCLSIVFALLYLLVGFLFRAIFRKAFSKSN